jgi:transcriptional regulator with XRE-family HTH domain
MAKDINELDQHIGHLIRSLRVAGGVSQASLAAQIGVTFQQVQKYENGKNRVSGSRLQMIAEALGVSPAKFFAKLGDTREIELSSLVDRNDTLRLLRAFQAVEGRRRVLIVQIAEMLGGAK